jgi:hypothetical protein
MSTCLLALAGPLASKTFEKGMRTYLAALKWLIETA